jgi:ABC-type proline/glycine betaine transport system permease subunit
MKRRLVILGAVVIAVTAIAASMIVAVCNDANERRAKFFDTSKNYPTTGGEKMKVDW